MQSYFIDSYNCEALKELLELADKDKFVQAGILLVAGDFNLQDTNFQNVISNGPFNIAGAIFPEVIFKGKSYQKGFLLLTFNRPMNICVIENLSDKSNELLEEELDEFHNYTEMATMFVFVDVLTKGISNLTEGLFNVIGPNNNYIGGGSGLLDLQSRYCLFTNTGIYKDAALLISSSLQSSLGVSHGFKKKLGPFQITKAQGNHILEINYKPAFNLYKEVMGEMGIKIDNKNFNELAALYPFGFSRLNGHLVIRDPIKIDQSEGIECIGPINHEGQLFIMEGSRELLLSSAREAVEKVGPFSTKCVPMVLNCISRTFILKDQINKELESVGQKSDQIVGAYVLGELANSKNEFIEFYNKTFVLAKIDGT